MSEVQEKLLALLIAFDGYCAEQGLAYTLLAGSLLGAVRHQGFIPWDDDADVGMPRPSFERLIAHADDFQRKTGYILEGHLGVPLAETPLLKVADPQIMVQPSREIEACPLWLDISPIDAMPNTLRETEELCRRTHRYQALLNFLASTPQSGRTPLRRAVKHAAWPLRRMRVLKRLASKRLVRTARALPWGSTDWVGSVSWGLSGVRERVEAARFSRYERMSLCGHTFAVMGCWEQYLVQTYGPTYMMPPSPEGRVTHLARAWDVKTGHSLSLSSGASS